MIYADNAIIELKGGNNYDYCGKCPSCGHVDQRWSRGNNISGNTTAGFGQRTCPKCSSKYKITVYSKN